MLGCLFANFTFLFVLTLCIAPTAAIYHDVQHEKCIYGTIHNALQGRTCQEIDAQEIDELSWKVAQCMWRPLGALPYCFIDSYIHFEDNATDAVHTMLEFVSFNFRSLCLTYEEYMLQASLLRTTSDVAKCSADILDTSEQRVGSNIPALAIGKAASIEAHVSCLRAAYAGERFLDHLTKSLEDIFTRANASLKTQEVEREQAWAFARFVSRRMYEVRRRMRMAQNLAAKHSFSSEMTKSKGYTFSAHASLFAAGTIFRTAWLRRATRLCQVITIIVGLISGTPSWGLRISSYLICLLVLFYGTREERDLGFLPDRRRFASDEASEISENCNGCCLDDEHYAY